MFKNRLPETCLTICIIGMLPLLALQVFQLWERPHFQFFPLAWMAFAWLTWRGSGGIARAEESWRVRLAKGIWGFGILACLLAVLWFSPWIANLAVVLCIFGWGLLRLGRIPWSRWFAWQALLWCAIPLPGNMDSTLVGKLQGLSSRSASSILDMVGVLHLQQGNVIEIRSRKLFVAEACSGIDSLYALTAVAVFIVIARKKPFLVALLSLLTIPLWAWLGNVLRLISITLLLEFGGLDFSAGWKHAVLGVITFALMSFFFFKAMEGFTQLFRRFSTSSLPQANRQWHLLYNRIVCFPETAPLLRNQQDEYFDEPPTTSPAGKTKPHSMPNATTSSSKWWGMPGLCVAISLLCFCSSLWLIAKQDDLYAAMTLPQFTTEQVDTAIPKEVLPTKLQNAVQVDFRPEHRSMEDFFGEHSRSWYYRDDTNTFTLSVDFPFRDFHPLWVCYTNVGNTVISQSREAISIDSPKGRHQANVHKVDLVDDANNASYLIFVNFDKDGETVADRMEYSLSELLVNRLFRPSPVHFKLPPVAYQSQLHVNSGAALSTEEKKHYESIFLEALPHMMSAVQKLNESATK